MQDIILKLESIYGTLADPDPITGDVQANLAAKLAEQIDALRALPRPLEDPPPSTPPVGP